MVDFKRPPFDVSAGFADAARANTDALLVTGSGLWVPARRLIPALALKAKLPTLFHQVQWVQWVQWADAGGMMSYGFNFEKMWRRGAEVLANVLRGAQPAEIPMEQPTELELVRNLKTARALSLKVPQAMRIRANRLIE